ncbi:MAG TPA: TonB-dependent receptor [Rhizomicrobium sp.]|nr:TonB-dependent receptor [Rhizomicrobium sp.]
MNTSAASADDADTPQSVEKLRDLSIEDLGNIEIYSVSKSAEPLSDAPAAIYVITHEDIRRSGAKTIPEMLRLAPNLEVAQVSGSGYAITARGFNGTTTTNGAGNKLLVLIDGRTVYTPLYAGVFWDLQYVLPRDIDRIEVISGPGAALWGANAVNGVINIITRNSADTQGDSGSVVAGNIDVQASAQHGGKIGENTTFRIYGAGTNRAADVLANGSDAKDSWNKFQGGFRLDWHPDSASVTVQGDIFWGKEDQTLPPDAVIGGHNLLVRWNQPLGGGSALQVQAYYDYNTLYIPGSLGDSLSTFDLDAQHSFSWGAQEIVWGGGYRVFHDKFDNTPSVQFLPAVTTHSLINFFVQDTISLSDTLKLILGTKFEDDPFVSPEWLPSARVSWKVSNNDLLWAAVSRAVRAPALWDRNLNEFLGNFHVLGSGNFQSEKLVAYEAGYRSAPLTNLSFSLSAYYNVYDDLRSYEITPVTLFPLVYGNKMFGHTYGGEFWGTYGIADWWRLSAGINLEHETLQFRKGSFSTLLGSNAPVAGNDPKHQFSLRSSMDLPHNMELDVGLRTIGALPNPAVPAYTEADARLGWHVMENLELSLAGFNLLHDHHAEFDAAPGRKEFERSFTVSAQWTF